MSAPLHEELHRHYAQLLGVSSPWKVTDVQLDLPARRVDIRLQWTPGQPASCPECHQECPLYDHLAERSWRHLDTMQFETRLHARLPRLQCPTHGVKTINAPWAQPGSRFTLLFERFAIDVLLAARSLTQAADLLRLDWDALHRIMARAVARGLSGRSLDELRHLGMDEKSFRSGQSYISLLTDLDGARVLDVTEGRTQEAAEALWQSLGAEQRRQVVAVALDMAQAYLAAARSQVPQAAVVHDKFHVAKHLNEGVDTVRRQEHRRLQRTGDDILSGSRQLWLMNPRDFTREEAVNFRALRDSGLAVARAWAMKELFTRFWNYSYLGSARKFFADWYGWVSRSRLRPMRVVGRMLKEHLPNLLTYIKHPICNAVTEGLNSKIQSIKSNARGFRSFENYRTRILFFCGKLQLYPQ
jgi:transposase